MDASRKTRPLRQRLNQVQRTWRGFVKPLNARRAAPMIRSRRNLPNACNRPTLRSPRCKPKPAQCQNATGDARNEGRIPHNVHRADLEPAYRVEKMGALAPPHFGPVSSTARSSRRWKRCAHRNRRSRPSARACAQRKEIELRQNQYGDALAQAQRDLIAQEIDVRRQALVQQQQSLYAEHANLMSSGLPCAAGWKSSLRLGLRSCCRRASGVA